MFVIWKYGRLRVYGNRSSREISASGLQRPTIKYKPIEGVNAFFGTIGKTEKHKAVTATQGRVIRGHG